MFISVVAERLDYESRYNAHLIKCRIKIQIKYS